jgi:Txe/YoeB family toxin of Txe-Axe toxin-antitoxin module
MKPVQVQFINEKVQKAFYELGDEDPALKKKIERAFNDICANPFCGVQIPKKQIPEDYIKKFDIKNVWKYNLPDAWRLLYSIEGGELRIITIVLEWLDHKNYERRFNY